MKRSSKKRAQQDRQRNGGHHEYRERPNSWTFDNDRGVPVPQQKRRATDVIDVKPFEPRSDRQARIMDRVRRARCVFLVGPAGTAKTYFAARKACELLARLNPHSTISKVLITRPNIEAGEPLGFFPGSQDDKMAAWVRPFIDNMKKVSFPEQIKWLIDNKDIETPGLGLIRGNGFDDTLLVLDEAQNATSEQLKMFLTRAGEGSQIVVTMDPDQCDLKDKDGRPAPERSAARDLEIFRGLPGVDVIYLTAADIQRSELVAILVEAYERAGR